MPSFDPVVAVSRGIEVLRVVNQLGEATITRIHQETNIHKSTVLRMLETLIHEGYVAHHPGGSSYVATGKCLLLSNGLQRINRLTQIATPIISSFRKSVGWPSDFAVFDQDAMIIGATSREFGVMSLNRKVGDRVPMLGSSLGRAYLAFCSDSERNAILDQLRESDSIWNGTAKKRRQVLKELNEIRKKGYATSGPGYRETVYDSAIWGISVPIMAGGSVMAAMNLIFLSSSMSLEEGVRAFHNKLRNVAKNIGEAIEQDFGLKAS
jgi:IclR family mhp operon transcriptional activator